MSEILGPALLLAGVGVGGTTIGVDGCPARMDEDAPRDDDASATEDFELLLFFAVAIYLGVAQPFQYAWVASAVVLAMFWHQASFIVHDAGHNGITHRRSVDYLLGAFLA